VGHASVELNPKASHSLNYIMEAVEETLCQKQTRFEEVYEQSPGAMVLVNEIGSIERVNVHAEALFGFSRERMLGQSIDMPVPSASVPNIWRIVPTT
jgi:PAS domain-containing protein